MELIRRKILLEDLTSRVSDNTYSNNNIGNYGSITADSIYIKVMLTQNIDDMGMFTDVDYTPNTIDPITVSDYYKYSDIITGNSSSNISLVKTYNRLTPYNPSVIINSNEYENYIGVNINGVSKVISLGDDIIYTIDGENDSNLGTDSQNTGILYKDKSDGLTEFRFKGEGWNETNTSLSNLLKEEMFIGLISKPEVQSDVFIDRGITSVIEPHLRLSEIESVEHLEKYNNGYFNFEVQ